MFVRISLHQGFFYFFFYRTPVPHFQAVFQLPGFNKKSAISDNRTLKDGYQPASVNPELTHPAMIEPIHVGFVITITCNSNRSREARLIGDEIRVSVPVGK